MRFNRPLSTPRIRRELKLFDLARWFRTPFPPAVGAGVIAISTSIGEKFVVNMHRRLA